MQVLLVSTVAAQALRTGERAAIFLRLAYPTVDAIFLKYGVYKISNEGTSGSGGKVCGIQDMVEDC